MHVNRRSLIGGLASLLAAPAIVRADSLMKIRGIILPPTFVTVTLDGFTAEITCGGWLTDLSVPHKQDIDVPWLGSIEKSMEWYNQNVTKYKDDFFEVRNITWHYPNGR